MSVLRNLGLLCLVLFVAFGKGGEAVTTPCFINAVYTNLVSNTVYNLCERYLAFYTTTESWHPEIPGFPVDSFSAVYTFQFTPVSTTTTFFILADTIVFKVNGVTYISLTGEGFFARQVSVTMPNLNPLTIEYQFFETRNEATLVLQWLNNGALTPFFDRVQPCGTTVGLPAKWWYQMDLDEFGASPNLDFYCEFAPDIAFGFNRPVVFDVAGFPAGQVSGRMEGCLRAPVQNQPVSFQQVANDGARYYINGVKLSDTWANDGSVTAMDTFSYTFTAASAAIKVEYRQNNRENVLTTLYKYQGYWQYIPLDDFFPKSPKVCPSTINAVAASGTCSKAVTFATPSFATCTPVVSITSTGPPSGSVFPIGTTNVVFTGTFDEGQTDTCSINIVVADHGEVYNTACPSDIVVAADSACLGYATWGAVTFSACNSYTVTNSHSPGSSFALGTTTVTYTATHSVSGLKATCQFTVTVVDQTPPVFTCPDVISNVPCDTPTTFTLTATDNCNPSPVFAQVSGISSGYFPVGTSRVSFTASDGLQSSSCAFNVIRNCFDVNLRMKNFASTRLSVDQTFTVQAVVTDSGTGIPVFDMEVNFVDTVQTLSVNGPGTYDFSSSYDHAGIRCIKVCLDDKKTAGGCSAQYRDLNCNGGSKRATTGAALQVSVQSPAGGDPHFLGFDGKIYNIEGIPGHVYNLISTPQLLINALFDEGWGEIGHIHKMKDVIRAVSVMWEQNSVTFQVDHDADFVGTIRAGANSYPLPSSSESFYLGSVRLDWEPVVNSTRQDLTMSRHNEVNHLTLKLANQFQVDLEAVWLESHHTRYFFVDLQVSFAEEGIYRGEVCLEGLWGRTSCLHNPEEVESPAQMEQYDLNGDLLSTDFPMSLFAVKK